MNHPATTSTLLIRTPSFCYVWISWWGEKSLCLHVESAHLVHFCMQDVATNTLGNGFFKKKKNGIDKRLLAQGTKIATFIQKNKNEQTTSGVFIPQHLALVCPFLRFCMPCKTESWSIFYFFNKNELEINLDKVSWQVEESIILHDDYSVFAFC